MNDEASVSIKEEKQTIRKLIKRRIKEIDREKLQQETHLVEERFLELAVYKDARVIMFYWSLPGEIETKNLIRKAKEENKIVALPVIGDDVSLQPYEFTHQEGLVKNALGIWEPNKETASKIDIRDLDVVVVPAVAFGKDNSRLGRGKGYYDRFLKRLSPKTCTIGLALSAQVLKNLPVSSQDKKVDVVISP